MSETSRTAADCNDSESIRESVIEDVKNGSRICRSGAWAAERIEWGDRETIHVYRLDEVLEQ